MLGAAVRLALVTSFAGYRWRADGVEVYSFRALFVALVLCPASVMMILYAISLFRLRNVLTAVAAGAGVGVVLALMTIQHQQERRVARRMAEVLEIQQRVYQDELWRVYGPAITACRPHWLGAKSRGQRRGCVEERSGRQIDTKTMNDQEFEWWARDPATPGIREP